jgi:hypothetical protein
VGPVVGPTGPRGDGRSSAQAAAAPRNVSGSTSADWGQAGKLDGGQVAPRGPWWGHLPPERISALRKPGRQYKPRRPQPPPETAQGVAARKTRHGSSGIPLRVPSAHAATPAGFMAALGWAQLPVVLCRRKELTQGMADKPIATRVETATGFQGIEGAVECGAQGSGNPDSQHTSGRIACRASSGQRDLHVLRATAEMGLQEVLERIDFLQKMFFVNINL